MTNHASSFPAAPSIGPLHRYGGRITALGELPIHALGDSYTVDGNGTILALPTLQPGVTIFLTMAGTPTFVNSRVLVCPGGVNYGASAGDLVIARSKDDGVWQIYVLPSSANSVALFGGATGVITLSADLAMAGNVLGLTSKSVVAYGADPTGAADSTTAIQSAINALTGGGTVYFPPGTYKISSALTIGSSGVSLIGAGRVSSVIKTTSTTANMLAVTASYTKVDSLGLVGSATVQTAGSAIFANGAQGCSFTNLYISDVFSGISMNNSTNCLVQFVKVVDVYGSFGVSSTNGGGNYIIDNQLDPVFYGAYTAGSGFGAWVASTAVALNAVRSANGGFFVCTQAGTTATGSGPVITVFSTAITDGTAKWLFICSTSSVGVSITATGNSNYVTNNDISGPWTAGILVNSSDGNILTGNTIGQIIGPSIQLGTSATNTLVEGNLISGAYGQFAAGIEDTNGSATFSRIFNNEVTNCGWYGIFIQSAGTLVQGNKVSAFGQVTGAYGIGVAAGTESFGVSGNMIVSGSSGCIQVATGASDFYSIVGNIVSGGTITDGGTGTHKSVTLNN